jgi:hypothetical protein
MTAAQSESKGMSQRLPVFPIKSIGTQESRKGGATRSEERFRFDGQERRTGKSACATERRRESLRLRAGRPARAGRELDGRLFAPFVSQGRQDGKLSYGRLFALVSQSRQDDGLRNEFGVIIDCFRADLFSGSFIFGLVYFVRPVRAGHFTAWEQPEFL